MSTGASARWTSQRGSRKRAYRARAVGRKAAPVQVDPQYLLRRRPRDLLDVDPSRGAHHQNRRLGLTVEDDPGVVFALDLRARRDEHAVNLVPADLHAEDPPRF